MKRIHRALQLVGVALALAVFCGPVVAGPPADADFGDTVTGNVKLTGDLSGSGTALVIGADDVTVDLNGYTISSTDGTGYGIDNTGGYDGVTIKNGWIEGFQEGIRSEGANDLTLRDLAVDGATGSGADTGVVHVLGGSGLRVQSCQISNASAFGGPHGIRLDSVAAAVVQNCDFEGCFAGVSFASPGFVGVPSDGRVQACAFDACFIAVFIGNAGDVKVLGNLIENGNDFGTGGGQGVRLSVRGASGDVQISGNEISDTAVGIAGSLSAPGYRITGLLVTDNEVYDCTSGGIQLQRGTDCRIAENVVYGNSFFGINLGLDTNECHIADNYVADNGLRGIVVTGNSDDNRITDNEVVDNGVEGITLFLNTNTGNWISGNLATGNGSYDLYHNATSTPNTWRDNYYVTSFGADIP